MGDGEAGGKPCLEHLKRYRDQMMRVVDRRYTAWTKAPVAIAAILFCTARPAGAQAPAARIINVTSESARGWTPSIAQQDLAKKTAEAFFEALDSGNPRLAYALLSEPNQKDRPLAVVAEELSKFRALSGSVKERRFLKTTWTKDPAKAPAPGVYVAIDLLTRFEGIDWHCGYIVLYQAPSREDFRVARQQDAFMDNATAKSIRDKGSMPGVEEIWSRVSASCPNYPKELAPLPEAQASAIGYPTVAAALKDLQSRKGVAFTQENGWTIATDVASRTIWSFAPAGYPAYPSAIKRQVVESGGSVSLQMKIHCEASKAICDDLVRSFQTLNDKALGASQK